MYLTSTLYSVTHHSRQQQKVPTGICLFFLFYTFKSSNSSVLPWNITGTSVCCDSIWICYTVFLLSPQLQLFLKKRDFQNQSDDTFLTYFSFPKQLFCVSVRSNYGQRETASTWTKNLHIYFKRITSRGETFLGISIFFGVVLVFSTSFCLSCVFFSLC